MVNFILYYNISTASPSKLKDEMTLSIIYEYKNFDFKHYIHVEKTT
jgi:hypothetical protein